MNTERKKHFNVILSSEDHLYLKRMCLDRGITMTEWVIEKIEVDKKQNNVKDHRQK